MKSSIGSAFGFALVLSFSNAALAQSDLCMGWGFKTGTKELAVCVVATRDLRYSKSSNQGSNLPDCRNSLAKETWTSCFGRKTEANGKIYVGEFLDNAQEGLGISYRENGSVEASGVWKGGDLISPMYLNLNKFPLQPQSREIPTISNLDTNINPESSKLVEKTIYLAELCSSMGLKGGTPEFSKCVVQLTKIVPYDTNVTKNARGNTTTNSTEQRLQEIESQNARLLEAVKQQELERLQREREAAQSQSILINEMRRQQEAEQLNSIARTLIEIGKPQPLAPVQITNPSPFVTPKTCNSRWNPISRSWQTMCD